MSSALSHYPPAMNTVGYKYLNGYGLPYSCETATKYYMQSSHETVNRIAKTKEPIHHSYNSLVDYEYVEKKFSNTIQPNSEDELEFYKLNAKEGKINYNNRELSKLINMPESTISKCNRSLERKGYLEGSSEIVKKFQLRELDQLFIWKFKEQDEKIQKNSEDIDYLKRELKRIKLENEEMKNLLNTKNKYII